MEIRINETKELKTLTFFHGNKDLAEAIVRDREDVALSTHYETDEDYRIFALSQEKYSYYSESFKIMKSNQAQMSFLEAYTGRTYPELRVYTHAEDLLAEAKRVKAEIERLMPEPEPFDFEGILY